MDRQHVGGHFTNLDYHRVLLDDPTRIDAYDRAIRALVRPNSRVLDVGTGTGLLAMLAARRGARRVHAVESGEISGLAEALFRANGLADRIVLHDTDIANIAPQEPVDLLVSDCMGRFLVDDGMLGAMSAGIRWLAPGGRTCPSAVQLVVAPAEVPLPQVNLFESGVCGLDFSLALPYALNTCYPGKLSATSLLSAPADHALYEPLRVAATSFDADHSFQIRRTGLLSALAGWFVATLAPGVILSTAPDVDTHWGQYLFPLPTTPVETGDRLTFRLWLIDDAGTPVWRWKGAVTRGNREVARFDLESAQRLGRRVTPTLAPPPSGRQAAMDAHQLAVKAFNAGELAKAAEFWEDAVRAMGPADDALAGTLYENLGVALMNLGKDGPAIRAFFRALDGLPTSRPQSLRFLVLCLARAGRNGDALRYLDMWESAFGAHPDGVRR